jgi:hypothetical protein
MPAGYVVEIKRGAEKCRHEDEEIGYSLDRETVAPFCIKPNILYLMDNAGINQLRFKHGWSVGDHNHPHFDLVVRVFHDDACPNMELINGVPLTSELNAMVIKRFPTLERGKEYFTCQIGFRDLRTDVAGENYFINNLVRWTQANELAAPLEMEQMHDDRCGLGIEINALKLTFGH